MDWCAGELSVAVQDLAQHRIEGGVNLNIQRLGFTGTRKGLSVHQQDWLLKYLPVAEIHHGACVGADELMHCYAMASRLPVVVHPPLKAELRMPYDPGATWLPAKEYLERDRDIVDATQALFATPDGPERTQSGTWYTVRYAVKTSKPVYICYPDGSLESR